MTSTGPRTESGKAASSRNAIKNGLFAVRDYVLPDENDAYNGAIADLWHHLKPQGILEQLHSAEIMTATWRLRRCALIEAGFATRDLSPDDLAKEQKSVDRARAQAHNILRRSTTELRKLQTEGAVRAELGARGFDIQNFPGLTDSRQLLSTIQSWEKRNPSPAPAMSPLEDLLAGADHSLGMKSTLVNEGGCPTYPGECGQPGMPLANSNGDVCRTYPGECGQPGIPLVNSSFCNPTLKMPPATPRNASCPCGSGEKFKRCCGTDAPPVLNQAA